MEQYSNNLVGHTTGSAQRDAHISMSAFVSSVSVAAAMVVTGTVVFLVLKSRVPSIYQPRVGEALRTSSLKPLHGWWTWIATVESISEDDFLNVAGVDAYLFVSFLRAIYQVLLVMSIPSIGLMVLNYIESPDDRPSEAFSRIRWQGINSARYLCPHVGMVVVVTMLISAVVLRESRHGIVMRHQYRQRHPQSDYVVELRDLPAHRLGDASIDQMQKLWEVYGLDHKHDYMHLDSVEGRHADLQRRCKEAKYALEETIHHEAQRTCRGPAGNTLQPSAPTQTKFRHITRTSCWWMTAIKRQMPWRRRCASKVPNGIVRRLKAYTEARSALSAWSHQSGSISAAVICYKDPRKALAAEHIAPSTTAFQPHVTRLLCDSASVQWSHLGVSRAEVIRRRWLTRVAICVLVGVWMVPVMFIASLSQLGTLISNVAWLRWARRLPSVVIIAVQGMLPSVLTVLLSLTFSIVLRAVIKLRYDLDPLATAQAVLRYRFLYDLVNLLNISICAGVVAVAFQLATNPTAVTWVLAANLPQASNYFLSYILLRTGQIAAELLAQPYRWLDRCSQTPRKLSPRQTWIRKREAGSICWGTYLPQYSILVITVIVYCLLAPLVVPLGCIVFRLLSFAHRYCFTYVCPEQSTNGGLLLPTLLSQVLTALYLLHACTIGLVVAVAGHGSVPYVAVIIGAMIYTLALTEHTRTDAFSRRSLVSLPCSTVTNSQDDRSPSSDINDNEVLISTKLFPIAQRWLGPVIEVWHDDETTAIDGSSLAM